MAFLNLGFFLCCRYVFNVITFYYILDFARISFFINNIDVSEEKKHATITIAFITGIYWVVRLVFYIITYLTELPYKRHEREINKKIKQMQLEEMERKKEKDSFSGEIERFLGHN